MVHKNLTAVFAAIVAVAASNLHPHTGNNQSAELLMQQLQGKYSEETQKSLPINGTCTWEDIAVRKEYGSLSREEKHDYIRAVQCLQRLPPKLSPQLVPGARNRWDDLVAAHINNTLDVHWTGRFFPWHRYFVHAWESALRDECNYTGYQPYWDWSKYAFLNWTENPIYDGSNASLSGNGKVIPHGGINITLPGGPPPIKSSIRPPGLGGGCVEGGPFQDRIATLGPVSVPKPPANDTSGLGYNPHCVTRDFLPSILQAQNSYQNVTEIILNYDTQEDMQLALEDQANGPHAGGHIYIGGTNDDLYSSPNDPLFFAHHAMIDRVWSIWQSRNFTDRLYQTSETLTLMNYPPSRNFTLDDTLVLNEAFDVLTARDAASTTMGRFCYMYE